MKTLTVLVTIILVAVFSAVGQSVRSTHDITDIQFLTKQKKAKELLENSNVQLTHKYEYFNGDGEVGDLIERRIEEKLVPDKWRLIIETNYPKPTKKLEYISDGKVVYLRLNNGNWFVNRENLVWGMISWDTEHEYVRYRIVGQFDLNGTKAEKVEVESRRIANQFATEELKQSGGIRLATYWFDLSGRILRKVEVNSIDNSKSTWVETQDYVYDPKDLKIEAPVK